MSVLKLINIAVSLSFRQKEKFKLDFSTSQSLNTISEYPNKLHVVYLADSIKNNKAQQKEVKAFEKRVIKKIL